MFGDDDMLFNMSIWELKETLMNYVYHTDHVQILRKRDERFEPMEGPIQAMSWVPEGTLPTVKEAKHRLELLTLNGPTEDAFRFRYFFEAQVAETAGA